MRHRFKKDAADELFAAVEHYESEQPGLGARFLAAFDEGRCAIKEAPTRWPISDQAARRYRIDPFPYHIVYQAQDDVIAIIAVAHTSRKPGYWRDRTG